jgi:hypothetical protein
MPRIRTIKPEFFRSPDTALCSYRARILYLAMWSWADDWGIGETNVYGLLGFAFCDTDEVTPAEIPCLLNEIQSAYEVEFYENRGRHFYAIPTWEKHQKTERRAAKRNPSPDEPDSKPDKRFHSDEETPRQNLGKSPIGTGEQGNRRTPLPPKRRNAAFATGRRSNGGVGKGARQNPRSQPHSPLPRCLSDR